MLDQSGRMVLVEPVGKLLPDKLLNMYQSLTTGGKRTPAALILDLTSIENLSTSGFKAIITLKMALKEDGCKLILTGMQEEVKAKLTSLGLDLIFPLNLSKGEVLWGKLSQVERFPWKVEKPEVAKADHVS